MLQKITQILKVCLLRAAGRLRVDAGRSVNTDMLFGDRHQLRPVIGRNPGHDPGADAGIPGLSEL
jgi:hypothetical protein